MIANPAKAWPVREGGSPPTSYPGAHSRGAALPDYAAFAQAMPRLKLGALTTKCLTQNRDNFFHLNCVPRQTAPSYTNDESKCADH
jgi:hypothetical protein